MTQQALDSELLERWGKGDALAGTLLVERHRAALQGFLSRRVSSDVDDIAQQTWLACVERRHGYRGDASFRTFMLQIARYQVYAYYRARRWRATLDPALLSHGGPSPSQELARHRELRGISRALAHLSAKHHDVLRLAFFEDLSGPQIAARLGIPEPTVRSRTRRALLQLRRHFDALSRPADRLDEVASPVRGLSRESSGWRSPPNTRTGPASAAGCRLRSAYPRQTP